VSGWLSDANVISELRRPRPDARARAFVAGLPLEQMFVSAVTLAEIRFGIETGGDPIRRTELTDWLVHKVCPRFDQRVPQVSEGVMFKWRLLVEDGRKADHTFLQPDPIIAAAALHHGLTVVTRDTGDYARARVPLFNPRDDEAQYATRRSWHPSW
jgi:toxin FitB